MLLEQHIFGTQNIPFSRFYVGKKAIHKISHENDAFPVPEKKGKASSPKPGKDTDRQGPVFHILTALTLLFH